MSKIYLIVNSLGRGGAERNVAALAVDLIGSGYETEVLYIENSSKSIDMTKVPTRRIGLFNGDMLVIRMVNYLYALIRLLFFKVLNKDAIYLSSLAYANIINSLSSPPFLLPKTMFSERSFVKDRLVNKPYMGVIVRFYSWCLRRGAVVISVSHSLEIALKEIGVDNVKTINNPFFGNVLEPSSFADKKRVDVVMIGRLEEVKNFQEIIYALPELLNYIDSVHIFGEGAERGPLEALVQQLGLEGMVRFRGFVTDPFEKLSNVKPILIVSSLSESFGNVVVEAMYYGVPVIVSDRAKGSLDIICEGKYGVVYKGGVKSSLVSKVAGFSEKAVYRKWSELASKRAGDFNRGKWLSLYLETLFYKP